VGKRRGHPIQRRAGERGRHFAACEVANRSIDFLAHLPRHPFSFTLSPAASNVCLLKEKQREAKRGGRRNKKRCTDLSMEGLSQVNRFRIHPISLNPYM
jgi:hypothetical protein